MDNCLFCKIIADPNQKQYFIYEDDEFVAFPDIAQFTHGHTLVIPKKHYTWVWDVPNIGQYFEVCQKIAIKMKQTYKTDQIYTLTMGSLVPHAHIHLIPKTEGRWYEALQRIGEIQKNRISNDEKLTVVKELTEK